MRQFTAGVNDDGLRLDRFISKLLPQLPQPLIQKLLRQKKVRVNGRHQPANTRVCKDDVITLYFRPELFENERDTQPYQLIKEPVLEVVYEDANLIVVNKPSGQSAHADAYGEKDTLIAHVQAHLLQNGSWQPENENSFSPALCHRIDRNTSGLVMAAKTHETLTIISEKLRQREIGKYYLCIVRGAPQPESGTFRDYIVRKPEHSVVTVSAHPVRDGRTAVTHYRTLARRDYGTESMTLLECRLETGRTHQIRAQMAFHGYPLLGDGKYGKLKPGHPRSQCLCACRLSFDFKSPAAGLDYLKGKTIELDTERFSEMFYGMGVNV